MHMIYNNVEQSSEMSRGSGEGFSVVARSRSAGALEVRQAESDVATIEKTSRALAKFLWIALDERVTDMLTYLIKRFVRDADLVDDPQVRARYGVLTGAMGIALNLMLFLVKLPIGLITGSMAIVSDAFNNISDLGSSLISLIGMRMAQRRPDKGHPFGHGRIEYLAALLVSLLIILLGVELLKESIKQLGVKEVVQLNPWLIVAMVISILVKVWMWRYNNHVGTLIHSGVVLAAGEDSRNDVIVTSVALVSAYISKYVSFPIDAISGILVSLLILYSGLKIAKETVDLLLGGRPDPELVKKIATDLMECEGVIGIHDMILHDYGPSRTMASVHAEISDDLDLNAAHELVDAAELKIKGDLGVDIVIHMDPIALRDARIKRARGQLQRTINLINPALSMHDLRMTHTKHQVDLIFDLVVPCEMNEEERVGVRTEIERHMQAIDPMYHCVIQMDEGFEN